MASAPMPRDRGDFEIAIICALPLEAECIYDVLDRVWKDKKYASASGDDNAYTLGVIGEHNVVIIHMPGMGTVRAASAVSVMKMSFPNIKLALVVGICGGMPYSSKNEEILLGDVVISKALIQYDFGKQYPHGFRRKTDILDTLGPSSEKVLAFLAKLGTRQHMQDIQNNTVSCLHAIQQKSPKTKHPGIENDILYPSSYPHKHRPPDTCDGCQNEDKVCGSVIEMECEDLGCESNMCVIRRRLVDPSTAQPKIHLGIMGSANTVLKSGDHRDVLAQQEDIIAVEMEGAGVWRHGPSVVIKGVCDYADSHKHKGWQQYAAATAAACTKAFLMEWTSGQKSSSSVSEAATNEYFLVPRQRVKDFFGREDEFAKIASYFDHDTGQPRIVVLHAMGGQGKSQIALEYCRRTRRLYRGVFWVNGNSISTATQSLVDIAHALEREATVALTNDDAKAALALRTLERWEHRWLIVFDNCDDTTTFSDLERFVPKDGRGNILFTSRHRDLGELGDILEVPPMPLKFGVALLLHRYRGINIGDYMSEGSKIVDRLGSLALAIDQASAYMQYIHLPIDKLSTFLPEYLAQRKKILQHTTTNFWRYTKIDNLHARETAINAFTTWEMSFRRLLDRWNQRDSVTHFLTLSAFLAPILINESLFEYHWELRQPPSNWLSTFSRPSTEDATDEDVSDTIGQGKSTQNQTVFDPSQAVTDSNKPKASWRSSHFWDLLYHASRTSLLQSISRGTGFEGANFLLHPLIRDWLQLRVSPLERQAYTREAVDVIVSSIKMSDKRHRGPHFKLTVLSHMDAVLVSDNEFFRHDHRLGWDIATCRSAGWFVRFYYSQGRYDASICLGRVEAKTREREQGKEHRDTLVCMGHLALALHYQAKYLEAEQLCRTVGGVQQRVLGKEHSDTLTSMNNLALCLSGQGKYSEAEQIYRTVIEAQERVLGKEHPITLASMNNLAVVLSHQDKYTEAEEIHRSVLEKESRVHGKSHPTTLVSMNNLGKVLCDQAKYIEAGRICYAVIEVQSIVIGKEHPDTLTSISNLAMVLCHQGKYTKAEEMCRTVIEKERRIRGKKHPMTLSSMSGLAVILAAQSKYTEAENVQLEVFKASHVVLGLQHPAVEAYRSILLQIWLEQGRKDDEIKNMYESILAANENA